MTASPDDALDLLDDPLVEAFGMVLETHNELIQAVNARLDADCDPVPIAWRGVLIRLARTPGERLRMTELARSMTMSTSGLTRLVDRIEEAGLVRREACPEDRRGTLAVLTPAGRADVARFAPDHVHDLAELLGGALSERQLGELTTSLRRIRDHVRGLADD